MNPRTSRGVCACLLVLVLGSPSLGAAQGVDPLSDRERLEGATDRAMLESAVDARLVCAALVDNVNDMARHWEKVRRGDLSRDEWATLEAEAREVWYRQSQACDAARGELAFESPTWQVLGWEKGLLEGVWSALIGVSQAWREEKPPEVLDAAAETYYARLQSYTRWLEGAATYWAGRWLESGERTCVGDSDDTASRLAVALRFEVAARPGQREPQALQTLESTRQGVLHAVRQCRGEELSPLLRLELDLLERRLAAYGSVIEGLRAADVDRVDEGMKEEQAVTERLVRCRAEHADGEVSPACEPSAPEN